MSSVTDQREFAFTSQDFERVRARLYEYCGIKLSAQKTDMVYSRLSRRLRALGLKTFSDYLQLVEDETGEEWDAFINALTTNLTSFFREPYHFPLLAEHIAHLQKRPIRLWCAASSTGEEPYSMAMTMADLFGTCRAPVEIIASDIDTQVLQKAMTGIYALDRLEKLPKESLKRYFVKGTGSRIGYAKVRDELRALVTFLPLNLLDQDWPVEGSFDAIFCRNVMIYFDRETQYKILARFVPLLEPHGLLFAGHSESLYHAADLFKLRGKTVYELSHRHGP